MKRTTKQGKCLSVLLSLAVLLSMLPLAMIPASAAGKELTGSLSITIPELKVGEKPWTDIAHPESISEGIYVSEISWIDKGTNGKGYNSVKSTDLLERGHIYACMISVRTLDGYTIKDMEYRDDYNNRRWTNSTVIYVNGVRQESENNGEDIYPVKNAYGDEATVIFPMLKEPARSVTIELDDPTAGSSPDFTPVVKQESYSLYSPTDLTSHFTNGVSWWDKTASKELSQSDKFIEGHVYQVVVGIKANTGYKVDGIGAFNVPNAYIGYHSATASHYAGNDAGKSDIVILTYDYGECHRKQVNSIEITAVAEPLPGCEPDVRVGLYGDEGYEYSNDVSYVKNGVGWFDQTESRFLDLGNSSDVFKEGHSYVFYLFVRPKEGYEFATNSTTADTTVSATVNGNNMKPQAYGNNSLKDYLIIRAEMGECNYKIIDDVRVENLDTKIFPGRTPAYSATVQYSAYTYNSSYRIKTEAWNNGIHWSDHTDNGRRLDPQNDTFIEGHYYMVYIDIVPQQGYKLAVKENGKSAVSAYINGKTASVSTYDKSDANYLISICTYVGLCETNVIDSVSVSGIEEPVPGQLPKYSAVSDEPNEYDLFYDFGTNGTNYAVDGVSWYDKTDSHYMKPGVDKFQSNHSYTCAVYLLPKTGYKFPEPTDKSNGILNIPGTLNGRTADYVRNNIGKLEQYGGVLVNYTYKPTDAPRLFSFSVDDVVTPRPGEKPSYTGTPGKFTKICTDSIANGMYGYYNGICWYDQTDSRDMEPDDVFIEGHVYDYHIVLQTTNGCVFNFAAEDPCSINGTINGKESLGMPVSSIESIRYKYLNAAITVGKCEPEPEGPVQTLWTIEVTSVTEPMAGEKPVFYAEVPTTGLHLDTSFNDEKYHNGVAWLDMSEYRYLGENDTFIADHWYQAEVVVSTNKGYEYYVSNSSNSGIYSYINGEKASSLTISGKDQKNTRYVYNDFGKCPANLSEKEYSISVDGGKASINGVTVNKSKFGVKVTITCNKSQLEQFDHWECTDEGIDIDNTHSPETQFLMPAESVKLKAVYKSDTDQFYKITVIGGRALNKNGDEIMSAKYGSTVYLSWDAPQDKQFVYWTADTNSIEIDDIHSPETTMLVPKRDVTITAIEQTSEPEVMHNIKVNGGIATNVYYTEIASAYKGDTVSLLWNYSADEQFIGWACDCTPIEIADRESSTTTFVMPDHDVELTAVSINNPTTSQQCTVTFHGNNETGDKKTVTVDKGSTLELPDCFFKAPEGYRFNKWSEGIIGALITVDSDITIYAHWEEIPESTLLLGDVDFDGLITANDALLILRSSVGLDTFTPDQNKAADVDTDGNVTSGDALAVLRYSAGFSDPGSRVGTPIT